MFPELPIKAKTPMTVTPNDSKGCFNCARLHTTCYDILHKMGRGSCWRPEGVALAWNEVEVAENRPGCAVVGFK